jgi:hypothetical protein
LKSHASTAWEPGFTATVAPCNEQPSIPGLFNSGACHGTRSRLQVAINFQWNQMLIDESKKPGKGKNEKVLGNSAVYGSLDERKVGN